MKGNFFSVSTYPHYFNIQLIRVLYYLHDRNVIQYMSILLFSRVCSLFDFSNFGVFWLIMSVCISPVWADGDTVNDAEFSAPVFGVLELVSLSLTRRHCSICFNPQVNGNMNVANALHV